MSRQIAIRAALVLATVPALGGCKALGSGSHSMASTASLTERLPDDFGTQQLELGRDRCRPVDWLDPDRYGVCPRWRSADQRYRSDGKSDLAPHASVTAISTIDTPRGLPVAGRSLTSRFGMRSHPVLGGRRMHSGIDLAAAAGSPVAAPAAGIVSFANWNGGYGLLVTVEHGNGVQTRFGHLSRLMVSPGQRVERGQLLGLVGSTGRSTGPHLHYEVRQSGRAVDPLAAR